MAPALLIFLSVVLVVAGQAPPVQLLSAPLSGEQAAPPVQCNAEAEAVVRSRNDAVQRWHAALQVRERSRSGSARTA